MAAFGATLGELAPLALAAGIVLLISRPEANKKNTVEDTSVSEYARMRDQQMEDMNAWGASASFWQAEHNKLVGLGAATNKDLSLMPHEREASLNGMFKEHCDVAAFDVADTMNVFDTRQGLVRMNKRNPIVSTLSEDLVNPADPTRIARFDSYHEMPNWANPAQVRQAKALLEADTDPQNAMRRHYGTELFNRAPGQSFRYTEG